MEVGVAVQQQLATGGFDPTAGVFVAQQSRPEWLRPVALDRLSPLQRSLLLIDGTVTQFLQGYLMEPVSVTRLGQQPRVLQQDDPWLQAPAGTPVVDRSVMLSGADSGCLCAYAESVIITGRLSPAMLAQLDTAAGGLGRILLDSELETRREALWYGIENPARLHDEVAALYRGACLLRSYRVIANDWPLMIITERFPLG